MKLNTAKKLTAGALALSMMFAMATPMAFAAGEEVDPTYKDVTSVTFYKDYNLVGDPTTAFSPADTFSFTIDGVGVTDAADGVTINTYGMPTVGTVSYIRGEAGSTTKTKEVTIDLPEYGSVGVYTYKIKEVARNAENNVTAGVTYWRNDIILKVTVVELNGKIRVAAVHTENAKPDGSYDTSKGDGSSKNDHFPNTYSAGSLAVTKEVTGLLGDQNKMFDVDVTFTAPAGKTVKETISYTDGDGATKTIPASAWTADDDDADNVTATVTISVKHGQTVTFTNIPYEVTYTVQEKDYADYTATHEFSDTNKKIDSASDTVLITNTKDGDVDTGVILDNAPYILMLAVVAGGAMTLVIKKRREEE